MCAGMMAMISAEATPAFTERVVSYVSIPRKNVATTPNHAGVKTQTSFKLMSTPKCCNPCQIQTDANCMPGYIVVPTGRPNGYHTVWSNHWKNFVAPFAAKYSAAL